MKKLLSGSALLPILAFALAMFIGGLLIAFSDTKVLSLRSEPWEMVKAGAATAWNAYVALFEGAFYDPNLARQGNGQGFYPISETLVVAAPLI